jgi:hypothetical protein
MIWKIAYIGVEFSFLHLLMHAIGSGYISPQVRGNRGGGLFEIVNFDILKCCFLTIGILSNLSQSSGNGISETLNLKISLGLRPSLTVPQSKRASTALHPLSYWHYNFT